ncbi:hypothetical protein [Prauserella alba]|uniref:Uncharacterized protein n=1 Tax=Prauserella alba TaxID=176898 RepID=A0ABN1V7M1_9PSEU|nr:hypothetical protein [Prauserella alba]MCP2181352.1 hypothetical protein [Prauserella alba]
MTGPSVPEPAASDPAVSDPAAASDTATPPGTSLSAEVPPPDAATRDVAERSAAIRRASAERRRIAEVFGEVLPETTADERDQRRGPATSEGWYLENRPPHHDR